MLVEFETVHSNVKEVMERDLASKLHGDDTVPFEHERDYLSLISIEMDNVIDFRAGKVWFNDREMDCIYAKVNLEYDEHTQNLLISYEDFKKVFEYATGKKVFNFREI